MRTSNMMKPGAKRHPRKCRVFTYAEKPAPCSFHDYSNKEGAKAPSNQTE